MSHLPPQAQRVFNGVIFDVYQWEQPLYDGTTATFEAVKRPDGAQAIVTVGDQILIAWEEQPTKAPTYGLLGGRIEANESPLAAVQRELLEEVGMVSDDWELLRELAMPDKIQMTSYFYVARNARKVAEPKQESGERIEPKLVSFEEFIRIATHEPFWVNREFVIELFRLKEDPARLEAFRRQVFGE